MGDLHFNLGERQMNPQLKILFKKELYEFRYNYKAWLIVIICMAASYIPWLRKHDISVFTASFFILLAVGQYVYNSYADETNCSGGIFIHNLNFKFLQVFFVKIFFSFVIAAVILIADIPNIKGVIKIADFFWLFPLIVTGSAVMQLSSVSSKGSEDTSATVSIIISFIMLVCIMLIQLIILRIITCIAFAAILVFISNKVSYSLKYRSQL